MSCGIRVHRLTCRGYKFKKQFLLPEQKAVDFLLMIYNIDQEDTNDIITSLRDINIILMCFDINVSTLKSKDNLLF